MGSGERAGNASLEEIAAAMFVRQDYLHPFHTTLNLRELYPSSEILAEIVGFGPAPNKAVVGKNAFAHESGIHQHGMLANPLCYEILTPEQVGASKSRMVLGKHSGRHGLNHRMTQLGYLLTDNQRDLLYGRFVNLAGRQKNVSDEDLSWLADELTITRAG
ncbi:MAG: pyruvate carboxyltransferase [Edaphobacter sp.]|nr:pyruvate carboxyltransferase [Edaphobacter sp.]